jgi:type I restriction-modification system DNA methylase subunit
MDNRTLLKSVIQDFSSDNLTNYFRAACGNFRPVDRDYSHYLKPDLSIEELDQLGQIRFPDERRLIVVVGKMETELTSRSGKKDQYDLAKKILKDELYDAGIFAFYDPEGNFRFSLVVVHYHGQRRTFSNYRRYTYFVSPETHNRTFLDQIGTASFESIDAVLEAFSVEVVTKEFFQTYEHIFREAEASIGLNWDAEQKRLYTQRFFNRLMFLAFLERKGWLIFNGRSDYLLAMFEDYWHHDPDKRPQANFHRKRLNALFFWGLNNPRGDERDREGYESLRSLIGQVPYLNGGLFEKEADDETWFFPDEIVAKILNELIYRFNFTVAESTPMDVEVAVDPEMLGKIFEELVTGRHESGSYYTPKPVVSFMCREAIKGYLKTALPGEQAEAVERFVDETNPADLRDPETVLTALRSVKACDPACGSGAYLLGLLHELLDLRAALFVSRNVDAQTVYERKLEIIQNNLYGVDIDPFAVNIARLRLWLSLIVDYEGDDPPPLPNLDFKIEAGDSLTAPDPSGGLQPDLFRYNQVQRFLRLKNEFMTAHSGSEEKRALAEEIEALRDEIAAWAHPDGVDGFDWAVDFAEIFAPQLAEGTLGGKFTGVINAVPGQMELFERKRGSGFDIVLTNPPYVRQELITRELGADYKERLKDLYPHAYVGTADLYVAFYARAHQLLRSGGVGCFISSNKWLRAGYGENLRQHLLDEQAFHLVVDFGELPVFQSAATFPAIFLWQKQKRDQIPTQWAVVKDLQACYDEGIRDYVNRIGENLPANQFRNDKPRLVSPSTVELRRRMEASGPKLSEYIDDAIFFGIKTGRNKAFIIDQQTRDKLISRDPNNAEIIKPLLYGDNIRHYEIHFRKNYIIFARQGINIKKLGWFRNK